ncbi:MAG TPA: glutamine-hydrolyzing carbamoyl-phosphate synthase small subunit, partial [Vampirovibrionales bacterium]
VFNTGLTGYQEILTDPSYAKQIVTLTYPEIGNYGISQIDNQSRRVFAEGLVIKSTGQKSSWRGIDNDLDGFLKKQNISGIYGLDTRKLTRHLRDKGAMRSVLCTNLNSIKNKDALLKEVLSSEKMAGQNLASVVTTPTNYKVAAQGKKIGKIAVIDLGLKLNMLQILSGLGFELEVLSSESSYEQIMATKPNGIFLSNGPGDPEAVTGFVEVAKKLVKDCPVPIFGVCLGHQILSIALGAKSFKLKFGHRGSNHPVKDLGTGRIYITSQNHGFAVDKESLNLEQLELTHVSLNDGTVEGIKHKTKPIFSVQFHPEACPGPHETAYLFEKFRDLVVQSV